MRESCCRGGGVGGAEGVEHEGKLSPTLKMSQFLPTPNIRPHIHHLALQLEAWWFPVGQAPDRLPLRPLELHEGVALRTHARQLRVALVD
jgi:hypothetical protein